ncbi:MAG: hypothetical protein P8L45_05375 [Longimicrobiales bacterium]|nr:hypothetical protein [Longimicrobiales bacterium]
MELIYQALPEMIATLIGVAVGGVGALYLDERRSLLEKRKRSQVILRNLKSELEDNFHRLADAKAAYEDTPYGKSFYISSIAWEAATAGGDLPEIIGYELTDKIEDQYAILLRLRYYVDLMTKLWFAPHDIEGYANIQDGFRGHILRALREAIDNHPNAIDHIAIAQTKLRAE